MRISCRVLTIVIGLAVVLALGQILIGQAPAQGGAAAPSEGPIVRGPDGKPDLKGDASVDVSATDFNDLARQLGA